MRFARRSLLIALLKEKSALQSMIEALEEYRAARMRRNIVQRNISDRPSNGPNRSIAPRRKR